VFQDTVPGNPVSSVEGFLFKILMQNGYSDQSFVFISA
jgi:hypothetical protein